VTTLAAALDSAPLLSAWRASHRPDLPAHLAQHGPAPLPEPGDRAWPDRFAAALDESGLTGRGGAAFPSAAKLRLLRAKGGAGTLVVNAVEGEPASRKDRVLLTCAPHLVLDGAELAAIALGATRVAVCVATDDRDAARAVTRAISERAGGPLAPVPFDVVPVVGGYVAGEESALAAAVDGRPGVPSFRPDKSVPLTIGRRPALVHNAETLAHMALVARHGPEWFRSLGCPDAPGTALVTVSGAVERGGVVEIAVGTSVRQIVEDCRPRGPVAAALVGGFGGAWVPSGALDTPYTPAALSELGAIVGPGVVVVLTDAYCGIAETARIAAYLAGESAGQCGPCVFGLPALASDLARLARGATGAGADPRPALAHRFAMVAGRGACRHPDGAVRMARSAMSVFAADVAAHAVGRPCASWRRPSVLGEVIGRWTPSSA
jgi:NADH:ubiquinone oxidoreductase subunit F (NADH-binding)